MLKLSYLVRICKQWPAAHNKFTTNTVDIEPPQKLLVTEQYGEMHQSFLSYCTTKPTFFQQSQLFGLLSILKALSKFAADVGSTKRTATAFRVSLKSSLTVALLVKKILASSIADDDHFWVFLSA
jgi:hypothetical protein